MNLASGHASKLAYLTRDTFINPWKKYLKIRNIENGTTEPSFPDKYGVEERHAFYKTVSGKLKKKNTR